MTTLSTEQIYVADLKVPSCLLPKKEVRRVIPKPDRFNIRSGYWTLRPPDEKSAVTGYADLSLTLEFVGANLRAAEERALKIARTFSSIASSYGGYPVETPYLYRVAIRGDYWRINIAASLPLQTLDHICSPLSIWRAHPISNST